MASYLFKRRGSDNWYLQLQGGPGGRVWKSLHTSNRTEAEILAAPYVQEHRKRLLENKPHAVAAWKPEYEPGKSHTGPDGRQVIALERELLVIGLDGTIVERRPNGRPGVMLEGRGPWSAGMLREVIAEHFGTPRPKVPAKDSDDDLIDTYIKQQNITGHFRNETLNGWKLYKTLVGKPLKDATRDDGRKLADHFAAKGLKPPTVRKKLMWLCAAVNLAIGEGKLKFNPFSGVVPKESKKARKARRRRILDSTDMKAAKANLEKLDDVDALLFRVLATTGMRLSEAYEIGQKVQVEIKRKGKTQLIETINGEQADDKSGIRFVTLGTKTDASERRVPFPKDLLPHLPKAIKAPLFEGTPAAASKRLNRFLRECGITDPRKVVHSLRHRAQDQLREAECPQVIRWQLLGHEDDTVSEGYGEGEPVRVLKKWIDRIGF